MGKQYFKKGNKILINSETIREIQMVKTDKTE
jgi:hypothetical protein